MIRVPLQSKRSFLTVVLDIIVSIIGYPQDGRTQEPGEQKNHTTPDATSMGVRNPWFGHLGEETYPHRLHNLCDVRAQGS